MEETAETGGDKVTLTDLNELEKTITEGYQEVTIVRSATIIGKSTKSIVLKLEVVLWDGHDYTTTFGYYSVPIPKQAMVHYAVSKDDKTFYADIRLS